MIFLFLCIACTLANGFLLLKHNDLHKTRISTSWQDTFILESEKPYFVAVSVPILLYLSWDPINKTKRVFSKVAELLRIENDFQIVTDATDQIINTCDNIRKNSKNDKSERDELNELVSFIISNQASYQSQINRSVESDLLWTIIYDSSSKSSKSKIKSSSGDNDGWIYLGSKKNIRVLIDTDKSSSDNSSRGDSNITVRKVAVKEEEEEENKQK